MKINADHNPELYLPIIIDWVSIHGAKIGFDPVFYENLTEDKIREMEDSAQKIMENIPTDDNGILFSQLVEKIGMCIFYDHGLTLCLKNKWIVQKGGYLVINTY